MVRAQARYSDAAILAALPASDQRDRLEGMVQSELYRQFLDFVQNDLQKERRLVNRRMFNVFFWCFLVPAFTGLTLIVLIKVGVLPRSFNRLLDWIIVFFPVGYSLYVLSLDMVNEIPAAFRYGGISSVLNRAKEEDRWRARVCEDLEQRFLSASLNRSHSDWDWVVQSFRTDLTNLQARTRYLTALAGAVFFLLLQGVEFLDPSSDFTLSASAFLNWFQSSMDNLSQFVGLGLFLVLLYLTGNQAHRSLVRYLHCAELLQLKSKDR